MPRPEVELRVTFPGRYPPGCKLGDMQGHYLTGDSPAAIVQAERLNSPNEPMCVQLWNWRDKDFNRDDVLLDERPLYGLPVV